MIDLYRYLLLSSWFDGITRISVHSEPIDIEITERIDIHYRKHSDTLNSQIKMEPITNLGVLLFHNSLYWFN